MSRIKALIVDDEAPARRRMRTLLSAHPEVEVVGEASCVDAAVLQIRKLNPDLLFLDIQMPRKNGFELFNEIQVGARVVFVTAFDRYAVRAFEVNALDYLLKPVKAVRLADSLRRINNEPKDRSVSVGDNNDLLCLKLGSSMKFVKSNQIAFITADSDYTEVHLFDGQEYLAHTTLRKWVSMLPSGFEQIHRSTIVNIDAIDGLHSKRNSGWQVVLTSQPEPLSVGRKFISGLRERLAQKATGDVQSN